MAPKHLDRLEAPRVPNDPDKYESYVKAWEIYRAKVNELRSEFKQDCKAARSRSREGPAEGGQSAPGGPSGPPQAPSGGPAAGRKDPRGKLPKQATVEDEVLPDGYHRFRGFGPEGEGESYNPRKRAKNRRKKAARKAKAIKRKAEAIRTEIALEKARLERLRIAEAEKRLKGEETYAGVARRAQKEAYRKAMSAELENKEKAKREFTERMQWIRAVSSASGLVGAAVVHGLSRAGAVRIQTKGAQVGRAENKMVNINTTEAAVQKGIARSRASAPGMI